MSRHRARYGWIIVAVLLGGAVVAFLAWRSREGDPGATPHYSVATVTRGDVVQAVHTAGTLSPWAAVEVSSQISGLVTEVHADFNSRVRKGGVLVRIDPSSFEQAMRQAEADLAAARASHEPLVLNERRMERLARRGLVTQQDYDEIQAQLIDATSGREQRLTTAQHPKLGSRHAWTPYWAPDGRSLYFFSDERLWKVSLDSDAPEAITPEGWDRDVVEIVTDSTHNQIWTTDRGRTVTLLTRDPKTKESGFHRIDVTTGAPTKLREEPRYYGYHWGTPTVSADGSTIVYLVESMQQPPDVWVAGADLANPRRLTELNSEISRLPLGESRVVEFLGSEGQPLKALLVLPPDYRPDVRYPTIVYVYPGQYAHSDQANRFGSAAVCGLGGWQMLATRGYAVLMPETPQELGTPLRDVVAGVHHAVNKVIEMGVADPDRLGVCGQSYGGYSTIGIVTQTTRFKGAVMSAGLADLIGAYLEFIPKNERDGAAWAEGGQGLMGGTPWQVRERYIENSPIMYLDRVRTPLLVVHGEEDAAVPVTLADQIFVGLRRLGREVEYRRYAGEGHAVSAKENLTDYWNAALRWFDTYVKNPMPP